ncbi:probable inactive receptor kinase At2g26730 [Amaranthus tricolor]|uniref:probable inactive receptor kinase At2g26730 n=1 Tax=Amaranthus tricolor TaxID=29722 RepID=UPI0025894019|nr:probable inactive receptor kinase At2g26730 [Amaranthus tricolor]
MRVPFPIVILLLVLTQRSNSEPTQEKQALQSFLSQVPHSPRIQWNQSQSACNWVGVQCDQSQTHIRSLRLPAVELLGSIPENTIGRLSELRILSIHSNSLTGTLPSDFSNLTFLRALYIGNNQFSGEFPSILTQLTRLTRLDLSNNNFSGEIPYAINNLTSLTGLFLQKNNFSGHIPSITANLQELNVANNTLNGSIPKSLQKFPESSFVGNLQLCGGPLPPCNSSFFPSPSPSPVAIVPSSPAEVGGKKKLSKGAIIGISVASALVLLLLLLCLVICCLRRRKAASKSTAAKSVSAGAAGSRAAEVGGGAGEAGTSSSKDDLTSGTGPEGGERNKLVFVNGGAYSFDLEDLLRASAEVLGKGSVGTSYKAVLEEGTTVVVKRLKDVVVGKKEFDMQMEVLGKCKHENLVVLRAYYYSRDEKLLVYDYLSAGSLSALLHGSRGSGRTSLDWENRMKIALGTARGLAYLHASNNIVHGDVKSSNILLHSNQDPAITDYGLSSLFSPNSSSNNNRIAGYRAPEVVETLKPTFKSDVYSFGVLLLELLTGKSPNQASLGDEGIDLPRWVQSVVREEWTAEVFDVELMRHHNIEEEMVLLLQIAMACVSTVPDQRPSMPDALRMIEDINRSESNTDGGIRPSSDDPSKGFDGHAQPMESRTPPSVTP